MVEDLPVGAHPDRPWGHSDNPKTVVWKYLRTMWSSRSMTPWTISC
ncbi:CmcI family methyltransferase [Mycobacterium intracellulare]